MAIPRLKAYPGHVLLSYGFRPFFFLGSCYAALAMAPDLAASFEHVVLVDAPRTPVDVERVTLALGAAGPSQGAPDSAAPVGAAAGCRARKPSR